MRVDAVIVGAGHNGLVTAALLGRAGLRTLVLEQRSLVGGACVTEELWPGYRVSRAAYVVGLLRPAVWRELGLASRGIRLLRRDPASYTPLEDGRGLLLGSSRERTTREIARFSARDAARYPDYERVLDRLARALEPTLDRPPPSLGRPGPRDLLGLVALGSRLLRLGRDLDDAVALLLGSARSTLESWFESEPLRGTLATDALIGAWASPSTPGSGYVLFHHVMGQTHGQRGTWAYVEGGIGRLSEALAEAAREAGCEIRTDAPVEAIEVDGGRVCGVRLRDGGVVECSLVVSNLDPRRTFLGLLDAGVLPGDFAARVRALDFRSPVAKINLALDRLPRFRGSAGTAPGPEHAGTIHLGAQTLTALDASFRAAEAGRLPDLPMIELTIPSALDPTLAPEGRHVASLFVQHIPSDWDEGRWRHERDRLADRVIAVVDRFAPGFGASVRHREILAPPDLERLFGMTGGNIFHGAMTLDRLLSFRPLPGWARYRTPVAGLYLCGAGTHPGGGIMGACGRNAAHQILRDRASARWRQRLRADGWERAQAGLW